MANNQKIDFKNYSWIYLTNPSKKELEQLREKYGFHPLDIADCLSASRRSKIDVYPHYTFIVFLFPTYDRKTREIKPAELDVFISTEYIITIQQNNLTVFNEFFNLLRISSDPREKYNDKSPEKLFYDIISKLSYAVFPMIDHLSDDCDNIEKAIFSGQERKMVSEILIIRRNITDCRRIMQVHKNVFKKIVSNFKESPLYIMKKADIYFEVLVDHTKEIWDMLENLKERIEALQQTNESQISFQLSDIMRILTIISVITFPLTLIATIFSMDTLHAMPFIDTPFGFWYVIIIMLTLGTSMVVIFKKKGWM
jgi:magnesium transporter